jgi:hypothetical protein
MKAGCAVGPTMSKSFEIAGVFALIVATAQVAR